MSWECLTLKHQELFVKRLISIKCKVDMHFFTGKEKRNDLSGSMLDTFCHLI